MATASKRIRLRSQSDDETVLVSNPSDIFPTSLSPDSESSQPFSHPSSSDVVPTSMSVKEEDYDDPDVVILQDPTELNFQFTPDGLVTFNNAIDPSSGAMVHSQLIQIVSTGTVEPNGILSELHHTKDKDKSKNDKSKSDEEKEYREEDILVARVRSELMQILPADCSSFVDISHENASGIYVVMMSQKAKKCIQRRIHFSTTGEVNIIVHSTHIAPETYTKNIKSTKLTKETVPQFIGMIMGVLNNVRKKVICVGVDCPKYKRLWTSCKSGKVDRNSFEEHRYFETFRAVQCEMLVKPNEMRCSHCLKLFFELKAKMVPAVKEKPSAPPQNTSAPEKELRKKIDAQNREIQSLRYRLEIVEEQMSKIVHSNGVTCPCIKSLCVDKQPKPQADGES